MFFPKYLNAFHIIMRMEQLRQQNVQQGNLRIILGAKHALSDSEEKKREDNFVKDERNFSRLKKENEAIKDRKIIRDIINVLKIFIEQ